MFARDVMDPGTPAAPLAVRLRRNGWGTVIIVFAALAIVGTFAPWSTLHTRGPYPVNNTTHAISDWEGTGWAIVALAAISIVITFETIRHDWLSSREIVGSLMGSTAVFTVFDVIDYGVWIRPTDFSFTVDWGLWLCVFSSIAASVTAFLWRTAASMAPSTKTGTPAVDETESL